MDNLHGHHPYSLATLTRSDSIGIPEVGRLVSRCVISPRLGEARSSA